MTVGHCPACQCIGSLKYKSNIDPSRITGISYASRKPPEFMHHDYFECSSCRTLFTCGVDTSATLSAYVDAPLEATEESLAAAITYRRLLAKELLTPPHSILDIGCGDGAFLRQMLNAGAKIAHGIEPSRAAASLNQDPRVEIKASTLSELGHTSKYEAICLFQTIEHVQKPQELLTLMMKHLAVGGSIFLICHDRLSLINLVLGRRSPIFDIEHLQLFTQNGVRLLLESCGLRVTTMHRFVNRYPLNYALRLVMPDLESPGWLSRVSIPVPAGNLFVRATLTFSND